MTGESIVVETVAGLAYAVAFDAHRVAPVGLASGRVVVVVAGERDTAVPNCRPGLAHTADASAIAADAAWRGSGIVGLGSKVRMGQQ